MKNSRCWWNLGAWVGLVAVSCDRPQPHDDAKTTEEIAQGLAAGHELVELTSAINGISSKQSYLHCPAGKKVVGAGFFPRDAADQTLDLLSARFFMPDWHGASWLMNVAGIGSPWKLTGQATCLDGAALSGYETTTHESALDATPTKQLTASCPPGKKAIAAGWGVVDPTRVIMDGKVASFAPSEDGNGWTVKATHHHSWVPAPTWRLQLRPVCVPEASLPGLRRVIAESPLDANAVKEVSLTCPGGGRPLGAGWSFVDAADTQVDGTAAWIRASGTGWTMRGRSSGTTRLRLTGHCAFGAAPATTSCGLPECPAGEATGDVELALSWAICALFPVTCLQTEASLALADAIAAVPRDERRRRCFANGGIALTSIWVSECQGATPGEFSPGNSFQRVVPQGLPPQDQECNGPRTGYSFSDIQCVYQDGGGQYYWDDGPSVPPAADFALGILTQYRGEYALLFWDAGRNHDYCYHHGSATHGFTKRQCDDRFRDDLFAICQRTLADRSKDFLGGLQACELAALAFHQAVAHFGDEAWNNMSTAVNFTPIEGLPGSRPTLPPGVANSHWMLVRSGGPVIELVADSSTRSFYGLTENRRSILAGGPSSGDETIQRISTPALQRIFAGGGVVHAATLGNANLLRLEGIAPGIGGGVLPQLTLRGRWTELGVPPGGPPAAFAVGGSGNVNALSSAKNGIWRHQSATGWLWIGGAAQRIDAFGDRLYATTFDAVLRYDGTPGSWTTIDTGSIGGVAQLAADFQHLYAIDSLRNGVYRFADGEWQRVDGGRRFDAIFPGRLLQARLAGDRSRLMRFDGSRWTALGGPAERAMELDVNAVSVIARTFDKRILELRRTAWTSSSPNPGGNCVDPSDSQCTELFTCDGGRSWDPCSCTCQCPSTQTFENGACQPI